MRRFMTLVALVSLLGPVGLTACAGPQTEEQAEVKQIDDELADIRNKLANPGVSDDDRDRLESRKTELIAHRENVMREAARKKEREQEAGK